MNQLIHSMQFKRRYQHTTTRIEGARKQKIPSSEMPINIISAFAAIGRSAYQVAIANGFIGSEVEWLASLQGADGAPGAQGIKGNTGDTGPTGATGATGAPGSDATVTEPAITTALGYTPYDGVTNALNFVKSADVTDLVVCADQAAYDALGTWPSTTVYIIL